MEEAEGVRSAGHQQLQFVRRPFEEAGARCVRLLLRDAHLGDERLGNLAAHLRGRGRAGGMVLVHPAGEASEHGDPLSTVVEPSTGIAPGEAPRPVPCLAESLGEDLIEFHAIGRQAPLGPVDQRDAGEKEGVSRERAEASAIPEQQLCDLVRLGVRLRPVRLALPRSQVRLPGAVGAVPLAQVVANVVLVEGLDNDSARRPGNVEARVADAAASHDEAVLRKGGAEGLEPAADLHPVTGHLVETVEEDEAPSLRKALFEEVRELPALLPRIPLMEIGRQRLDDAGPPGPPDTVELGTEFGEPADARKDRQQPFVNAEFLATGGAPPRGDDGKPSQQG